MTHPAPIPPALPAPTPQPHALMLRHGIATVVVDTLIGLWLGTMQNGGFIPALIYSHAIGTLCWLTLDGGRLLISRQLARLHPEDRHYRGGWPGWGWMTLLILLGVPCAYLTGVTLGDLATGHVSALPWRHGWSEQHGRSGFVFMLLLSFFVAAVLSGFGYVRYSLLATRAEAEAVRRIASETQLRLIESQLEPHMMFNTLANLRVLIGIDPPRAQAMLDRLIAFLRATLNASRSGSMHPLQAEFERLDDYLALMGIRMGARLQVWLDLPEVLRRQPVPPLLLQPLVENCIKHGLEPSEEGGRIEVRARAEADRLILTVRDTGVGLPPPGSPAATAGTAFGTAQVRERLASLYGDRARFELSPATDADGGTLAHIELPLTPDDTPNRT